MPEIEGYKVSLLKLTPDTKIGHHIYMREHFIRLMDPNKPRGRTLFLLNIPPYVTEKSLMEFFKRFGEVIMVSFAEKPGRDETQKWQEYTTPFTNNEPPFKFKVAYVVFKESKSVPRALLAKSIDLFSETTGESLIETGLQLWHSQHEKKILNVEETQIEIDKYMVDYEQREKVANEAAKTSAADADGWVTVGKQGRNAGFEQKESVIDRIEQKVAKDKKNKELTNFYTFQIRESKMKNIVNLRKKFEEDKQKIELLKKSRRFRPF
ncbi:ribosomal RNA-processing protein 7 homolog A-like [Teleopsis dalmanni]|uniref:ribosomal RNA-processing protein 7 homolog A-like n=1 Tax=Teleopsis dalmanni TaxID=139649 RepID=UPI000D32C69E|nr:ribosomal RNA-processing protein 7 homolog A-like [Teleopsis dalmanni]